MSCTKDIYIVYIVINLVNRKYYIGAHKQKEGFGPYEFDGYLGSGLHIQRSLEKYNKDNFIRITLFHGFADWKSCLKYEKEFLGDKWKLKECYNLLPGGSGFIADREETNKNISKAVKEKFKSDPSIQERMSLARKGISLSEETKQKMSGSRTGKTHSEETKQKISNKHKGKKLSLETKQKISNEKKGKIPWNKGIPHSEETKRKMSESGKNRPPISKETATKISNKLKGKTFRIYKPISEEHKQKIRDAAARKRITYVICR